MASTLQHTLQYSETANKTPAFQSYAQINGTDPNLNRSVKRYYSSQDASVYFGDFYIDDIHAIEFEVSESAMLMYGYNSYTFDHVAKGARMVQGRFSIHFTQANYLSKVLSDLSVYKGTGQITHSHYHPTWPSGFDIFIHYGNAVNNDLQLIALQEIHLTGCTMQTDARTGQPISELYTFIGKDVLFGAELQQVAINNAPNDTTEPEAVTHTFALSFDTKTHLITLNLNRFYAIEKITYAFDGHTVFTSAGIEMHYDYVTITPSAELVALWDEEIIDLTVYLYTAEQEAPFVIEETFQRKHYENPSFAFADQDAL